VRMLWLSRNDTRTGRLDSTEPQRLGVSRLDSSDSTGSGDTVGGAWAVFLWTAKPLTALDSFSCQQAAAGRVTSFGLKQGNHRGCCWHEAAASLVHRAACVIPSLSCAVPCQQCSANAQQMHSKCKADL
jgi:hypothetical protein